MSAALERRLVAVRRGSDAERCAREELSTTDGAHVHNAADGCPSPEPHDHVGAKPRRTAERLPFTRRASEEAAQKAAEAALAHRD